MVWKTAPPADSQALASRSANIVSELRKSGISQLRKCANRNCEHYLWHPKLDTVLWKRGVGSKAAERQLLGEPAKKTVWSLRGSALSLPRLSFVQLDLGRVHLPG